MLRLFLPLLLIVCAGSAPATNGIGDEELLVLKMAGNVSNVNKCIRKHFALLQAIEVKQGYPLTPAQQQWLMRVWLRAVADSTPLARTPY
jgi:hypothetical protein